MIVTRSEQIEPGLYRISMVPKEKQIKCFGANDIVRDLYTVLKEGGYNAQYANRRILFPKHTTNMVFTHSPIGGLCCDYRKKGYIRCHLSIEDAVELCKEWMAGG